LFSKIYVMDIKLDIDSLTDLENSNFKVDIIKFQKMILLFNAVQQGWSVKKRNELYVFTKPHENKREVLDDSYLAKFMKTNLDLNKILT